MFVFYPSDFIIYLLCILILLSFIAPVFSLKIRRFWIELLSYRSAVISLMIVLVYVGIAFLDSIHYQHNAHTLSFLDRFFNLKQNEKTYSSPLAIYSFEATQKPLKYAGRHLKHESEHFNDILKKVFFSLLISVFSFLILSFGIIVINIYQYKWDKQWWQHFFKPLPDEVAWRTALMMISFFIFFISLAWFLGENYYLLGTDKVGESVLYQVIKSIRTAIVIGFAPLLLVAPIAISLGICAAYFSSWVDDIIQYIYTVISSIPSILLIASAILSIQLFLESNLSWSQDSYMRSDLRLMALCVVIGLSSWVALCRLVRSETLKIKQLKFISAAKLFGIPSFKLIWHHILPNTYYLVIISLVMDFSGLVLAEAILSYIGIGVDPTLYSFGTLLNQSRWEIAREPVIWWPLLATFIWMLLLVLSVNLFADKLQIVLNPKNHRLLSLD